MDEFVRSIIEAKGAWGGRESQVAHGPSELQNDYAARIIALLIERTGGRVEFRPDEIQDVPGRLVLLVYSVEPAGSEPPGLALEIRRLASN